MALSFSYGYRAINLVALRGDSMVGFLWVVPALIALVAGLATAAVSQDLGKLRAHRKTPAWLIGGIAVAIPVAAVVAFWFASNPSGLGRQQATGVLVRFAAQALALSAVTGFAAMATLEIAKRLFRLRGRYFVLAIAKSIRLAMLEPYIRKPGENPEMLPYRTAVARFDMPLEQLIAQISHLVDQELDGFAGRSWRQHPTPVLDGLLGGLAAADTPPPSPVAPSVPSEPQGTASPVTAQAADRLSLNPASAEADVNSLSQVRAKAEAALDALQIQLGSAWRFRLRLAGCWLAALFAVAALIYVPVPPGTKVAALVASFVLGGFLAGFFRDLTALVERYRR